MEVQLRRDMDQLVSAARQKGTAAESAVVRYLADHGFPTAERRALHGALDQGDVTGIPGVVVEVKNHRKYAFAEWLKELAEEKANAKADTAFLVVKPRGVGATRTGEWMCVMPLADMCRLLTEAGWGEAA